MNAPIENNACPIDAIDNVTQAREILQWMEALGAATRDALNNNQLSRAKALASLTSYLGCDWSNHFDCKAEELNAAHGVAK
ncbi:hypothetical protein [Stutzerimonas zhaodongensis]|jgi:hypothetical protein|uniref:Uncharacterized protein n=1 Tax=Stutzerimonas zhaodongensis TaxID=1176257 RepID=A0A365Q100_9GAMM|nr:hypothetical protein [Stutzerimonas zhaodongensis]QWV15479.1 hypothetical protein KQ248_12990 [Stutzerimonas zhaodongensis]RBA62529.1 hypothetical protein DQ403_02885 [Stutzerimonas zhaodongensis]